MPVSATTHPTLLDYTKRQDPDKSIATIVETLAQTNEVLEDMVQIEGNLETGHRTTIRSGLPAPTWRKLYGGVQPTKSETVQVTDTIGMMEAYAEVDKQLADLNGNTAAFRLSEDMAHIEGMNQEFTRTLFYGDEGTDVEEFTGFRARFDDSTASNGTNTAGLDLAPTTTPASGWSSGVRTPATASTPRAARWACPRKTRVR
jgi:hypothetical protein